MNDTQTATECNTVPHDPAMAAADPAMFSPMTLDQNRILYAHLNSGWYKQADVYPLLSEPWRETGALLDDLGAAWKATRQAERKAEAPEAGS
jgi:hypothetical protein